MRGESVTVLTAGTVTDPYSTQPVADWDDPAEVTVTGVLVEPRPSGEPLQDARNQVTSGYTLYFQTIPTVPVTPANRVRVRGVIHDVLGEPADWDNGDWHPGQVIQCERSVG